MRLYTVIVWKLVYLLLKVMTTLALLQSENSPQDQTTGAQSLLQNLKQVSEIMSGSKDKADVQKRFDWPHVEVSVHRNQRQTYSVSEPIVPNMSARAAIVSAARRYHLTNSHRRNPFAIQLYWNFSQQCYAIFKAANVENSSHRSWIMVIEDGAGNILYHSQCLPEDDYIILRPGYQLQMFYT